MKTKINITENNILDGKKANPQNCAIAKAIRREFKNKILDISVLPSHIALSLKNREELFAKMPKEGADFIKRFDRGLPVNRLKLNLNFTKKFNLV
jgi:hypothetical protein